MVKATFDSDTVKKIEELSRIGHRAVRRAQEESRRLGVPNVYSVNGILYYELPNGELSRTDPYRQCPADDSAASHGHSSG